MERSVVPAAVPNPVTRTYVDTRGSFATSDGVTIRYRRYGSGPPLLLVHGGGTDHRCFDPLRDRLARRFTVTAYDRRGMGDSGDGGDHSLEREAEDFAEAVAVAGDGEPVAVIGYSFGATAALRAVCTRPVPVRALVAYEAPFPVPGMFPAVEQVNALVAAGRHDEALRLFVGTTFHLGGALVEAMAAHPMWRVSLAAMRRLPREAAAMLTARIEPPAVPVPPVRYLVAAEGGNPAFREIAATVARVLPGADVATVPGVPHFAMASRPDAFADRALEHLQRYA